MTRFQIFQLIRWASKPIYNRYVYLMVRDNPGIERFERTMLLNHRKMTGRFCDWILQIKC